MIRLLLRLWADDGGALISTEWLCLSSLATLGVITGAVAVRDAVTTEFTEQARSIQAISARYRAPILRAAQGGPGQHAAPATAPELVPSF